MIVKSFSDLENAFIYIKLARKLGLGCTMRGLFFGGLELKIDGRKEDINKFNKIFNKGKISRDWNVFINIMSERFIKEVASGK